MSSKYSGNERGNAYSEVYGHFVPEQFSFSRSELLNMVNINKIILQKP